MPVQTRTRSRASSAQPDFMASTPRRSARVAARTPSVVDSDAESEAGRRRGGRASKDPTNAGQVGRLVSTRTSTSRAYGSVGTDGRSSAEPEAMVIPNVHQDFASTFSRQRERNRASAAGSLTGDGLPGIPEASEASSKSKAPSITGQHSKSSRRSAAHRLSISDHGPSPTPDVRPESRGTNATSFVSRSWNDLREAAFIGWATHHPPWYDVLRRILHKIFSPIFAVLFAMSKFSAMLIGLLSSLLFIYLLFDLSIKTLFCNITAADYMRERSVQITQLFPGYGPIIQPFPIAGEQYGQITSLHNNIVQVQNQVGLLAKDVDYLQRKIPDNVMLTFNPKTGRNEIPGAFWHALRDNLAKEGFMTGNRGDHGTHSTHGNSASWTDFWKHNQAHLSAYLSTEVDNKVKDAIKDHALVDRATFISMVEDQARRLEVRMADLESSWSKKLDSKFKSLVDSMPKGQLNTVTSSLLLENSWSALHSVDFFSRGMGTGQAQIGVIMPHLIVPETLVVEHIPREGTLDIGSAPRGMEVWVEVEEEEVRRAFPEVDGSPGEKFVRVGSFEYRVDALNHVQAFGLSSGLLTPVRRVVVRVTGTWGRDWTCLYRLRMNGRSVDEFNGYSE
ncbi:putative spindle pole body-associated protein sad1 protein [Neofusicoccum parvum UCRNP2]|uniref:Putative spindle pole body-associated protein sad1 protein n=1 Tax=Botryosphaeria parva (strain UCR-NP2) TaxID=1287680 RepID=R1GCH4_BOTPV|nr:putative spindle pole body-associated protein sad1 protein [Neofusicoccum parvum UCRNP2]